MDDYYCVEELSDHEMIDTSSDDEDFKSLFTSNEPEDDEDFETEMERERLNHVNGVHKETNLPSNQTNSEEPDNERLKNDELLYDPESDESDQKWVDRQRLMANKASNGSSKLATSDATLNCPCCMSLLCLDCQRHVIYKTQYRAMFVLNCRIDFTQKLQYKKQKVKMETKSVQ